MGRRLSRLKPSRLSPRARRNILVGFLAVVAFGLAVLAAAWSRACAGNTCPSIEELGGYDPDQASKVYAADGRLITDLGLERRTVIPLGEMSPYVKTAFLATEDKRFYSHHGIDWFRVFGAIKTNVFQLRFAEGFSTITMQLARNIWVEDISGTDKSLRRKLREAKVAREIEKKYPKDKILEIYLNQIPLGNGAYGVEAASQRYFGKSVRDLNVAEAATLAAIPKAPTRYNPRRNPNLNIQRRNTVLNLLRDNGLLNGERDRALEGISAAALLPLGLQRRGRVLRRVCAAAAGGAIRPGALHHGLPDLHQPGSRYSAGGRARAGGAAGSHRERGRWQVHPRDLPAVHGLPLGQREDNSRTTTPYLQGLAVTLEAKTGYIRAMVGGRDFEDSKFNRATQALRQPGLYLQADRIRRRGRGRISALACDGGRPAQRGAGSYRAALGAAELRSGVRRADDAAASAVPLAQHHRHQAGHGAGRAGGHQRGHQVRAHHPGAGIPVDSHRLGRRDSAGDDRGLYHVRQSGDPHRSQCGAAGRRPRRQDRVAAAGANGGGDGHPRMRG